MLVSGDSRKRLPFQGDRLNALIADRKVIKPVPKKKPSPRIHFASGTPVYANIQDFWTAQDATLGRRAIGIEEPGLRKAIKQNLQCNLHVFLGEM